MCDLREVCCFRPFVFVVLFLFVVFFKEMHCFPECTAFTRARVRGHCVVDKLVFYFCVCVCVCCVHTSRRYEVSRTPVWLVGVASDSFGIAEACYCGLKWVCFSEVKVI